MPRARRRIAVALAALVVAGMLVGDALTLRQAKPSFRTETQGFAKLLHPPPLPRHPPMTTVPTVPTSTTSTTTPPTSP